MKTEVFFNRNVWEDLLFPVSRNGLIEFIFETKVDIYYVVLEFYLSMCSLVIYRMLFIHACSYVV